MNNIRSRKHEKDCEEALNAWDTGLWREMAVIIILAFRKQVLVMYLVQDDL